MTPRAKSASAICSAVAPLGISTRTTSLPWAGRAVWGAGTSLRTASGLPRESSTATAARPAMTALLINQVSLRFIGGGSWEGHRSWG